MPRQTYNTEVVRMGATVGVSLYPTTAAQIIAGSPTPARFYRRNSGPAQRIEGAPGTGTIDTVAVCSFTDPAFPVKINDTVPMPETAVKSTTVAAPGTAAAATTVPVASSAGFAVNDLVLIGAGTLQEARIVLTVPDGTHITVAALTFAHAAAVAVVKPAMAKIITIQPYTRSKQCDIEQGAE